MTVSTPVDSRSVTEPILSLLQLMVTTPDLFPCETVDVLEHQERLEADAPRAVILDSPSGSRPSMALPVTREANLAIENAARKRRPLLFTPRSFLFI